MPITEKDGKYYVKDEEFDTEEKASEAYMAYLDKAMGVDSSRARGKSEDKPKVKKSTKKLS